MAKNFVQTGDVLWLTVDAGKLSGEPVAVGNIRGVCLTDANTSNQASVQRVGVFDLPVVPQDDDGASAVAFGDALYISKQGSPLADVIDKKSKTGVYFGTALGAVAASPLAASTIPVLLADGASLDAVKGTIVAAGTFEVVASPAITTAFDVTVSGLAAGDIVLAELQVNATASPKNSIRSAIIGGSPLSKITITSWENFTVGDKIGWTVIRPA